MKPDEILRVYKYDVITRFRENAILPAYKGATLRGAFGIAFKNSICVNKKIQDCNGCLISNKCIYKQIFNTEVISDEKSQNFPQPFILEPPYDRQTFYGKNDYLKFGLIIIDKMVDYFPYFVLTFKLMGEKGIGIRKKRSEFDLIKIKNRTRIVFDGKTQNIKDYRKPVKISIPKIKQNLLTLNFISPTRIKIEGELINGLPFVLFIKSLLRRISLLKKNYSDNKNFKIDYDALLEKACNIQTVSSSLRWYDWQRFSSRQKTTMKLGGFTGQITYSGEIQEFIPYIKLGEIIHIGKNTSFGLGKYVII
ncbi:MAG TPA: CRISPR system precrRNA processing endoribonuclease RAMP protein Cas6 [Candidatus Ratteibacteria bacterium]|nr:CRISPR system precrRNA processing endoribonuclease RAMP protein Cas6 [bacterium]HOQ81490.1 CRISPR system precrRNA processing endoribonuclease RAMP protein Cas6 [bacterium]HRS05500.1 CRISPR system precrRNA processing endoribonuclease RAMP protein Cas6 [Candidatus Ratteibacteria bacterium]HRV05013.1 CRISPR system precrRNA processing endoribonuclease RAMP protein Cas6 [Candidatus Ratteibacteria bacterium]